MAAALCTIDENDPQNQVQNLHGMSAVFAWNNIPRECNSHRRTWAFAWALGTQSRMDCTLGHIQEKLAYIQEHILHSCSLVANKVQDQYNEENKHCCMGKDHRMAKNKKPWWAIEE